MAFRLLLYHQNLASAFRLVLLLPTLYTEVDFRNFFWLPEVDFRWWFSISGSRLPVMIFDFRKSTSGDDFWLPEVIYFDFRKSTSGSIFGVVISVRFFKWSKGILGILRFFGGAEEMLGGVGRKTLKIRCEK